MLQVHFAGSDNSLAHILGWEGKVNHRRLGWVVLNFLHARVSETKFTLFPKGQNLKKSIGNEPISLVGVAASYLPCCCWVFLSKQLNPQNVPWKKQHKQHSRSSRTIFGFSYVNAWILTCFASWWISKIRSVARYKMFFVTSTCYVISVSCCKKLQIADLAAVKKYLPLHMKSLCNNLFSARCPM